MIARLAGLLPVLVGATMLGRATGAWDLAALVALAAAALALVGPRWELDRGRRLLTSAMGAAVGYAAVAALYEQQGPGLGELWARLAAAGLLASAARFLVVQASRAGTVVLSFSSMLAIGQTRSDGYIAAVALFLLTSVFALSADPSPRTPAARAGSRRAAVAFGMLVVAAVMTLGGTLSVRAAHSWLARRVRTSALSWEPRVGFSDRMELGALDGLLDSDEVVMRVRGPRVDHLRGAVLDFYAAGLWQRSVAAELSLPESFTPAASAGDLVQISVLSSRTDRVFVPLEAKGIATTPVSVMVDPLGVIKRAGGRGTSNAQFTRGARERAQPSAPSAYDLQVPRYMRPELARLAEDWTRGKSGPNAKLDALELRLQGYRYSRNVPHLSSADPLLAFLFERKSGHCEYFATALALLARSAGIPARVVTGYRVAERSPFGYYVVRERNAHAWIEAWLPGAGWVTRDPTPELYLPQNHEHEAGYVASALDALDLGYEETADWLSRLTLEQTALGWLAGLFILAWIVGRGAIRRRTLRARLPDDELALPALERLLSSLARQGQVRESSEPIERFAARLTDARAAELLKRYAALRYGDIGSARELEHDIETYARTAQPKRWQGVELAGR